MAESPEKKTVTQDNQAPSAPAGSGGGGLSLWQRVGRRGGETDPVKGAFDQFEKGILTVGEENREIGKLIKKGLEDEKLARNFLQQLRKKFEKKLDSPLLLTRKLFEAAAEVGKKHEAAGVDYIKVLHHLLGAEQRGSVMRKHDLPHGELSLQVYSDACDIAEQFEKAATPGLIFLKNELERGKFTPDPGRRLLNSEVFRTKTRERILQSLKSMAIKYGELRGQVRDLAADLIVNRVATAPYELGLAFGAIVEASRGDEEKGISTLFRIHGATKTEEPELLADAAQELVRPLTSKQNLLELFNAKSRTAILKRQSLFARLDETGMLGGRVKGSLLEYFENALSQHEAIGDIERQMNGEEKLAARHISAARKESKQQIKDRLAESAVTAEGAKSTAQQEIELRRKRTRNQIEAVTAAKDQRVGDKEIETAGLIDKNDTRIAEIDEEIRLLKAERAGLVEENARLADGAETDRGELDLRLQNAIDHLTKKGEKAERQIVARKERNIALLQQETETDTARMQRESEEITQARETQRDKTLQSLRDQIAGIEQQMGQNEKILFIRPHKENKKHGGVDPLEELGIHTPGQS